jgi:hypothetical protein
LYNNSTAIGTPIFTDPNEPLSGGMATSASFTTTATGTLFWVATYNGDPNNNSVTSGPADEPVVVNKFTPTITSVANPHGTVTGPATIMDTATISGFNPTGTITFTLTLPNNSTITVSTVTVNGNATYNSANFAATQAGTYTWHATYSGDPNNNGPVSDQSGVLEQVTLISSPVIGKIDLLGSKFVNQPVTTSVVGNATYIISLYHNLLNRNPDAPSFNACYLALQAGMPRGQLAQILWQSQEHRTLEVQQDFVTFYHHTGTASQIAPYVNMFLAGAGETNVEFAFLTSPEYMANHVTSASFITGLFNDVLGRPPKPAGLAAWQQALASGLSRPAAAMAFLTSAEFYKREVDQIFSKFLNRLPSSTEEQTGINFLTTGGTIERIAEVMLGSAEYYEYSH